MKIKQTAKKINNVTGPITITGTTATTPDGTVIKVGVDKPTKKETGR